MAKFDLITIGSATRDIIYRLSGGVMVPKFKKNNNQDSLIFSLGSKFEASEAYFNYGGGSNNVAVSLARLGFKVGAIMAIGDDDFGNHLKQYLKKAKVNTKLIQTVKNQPTGLSFIISRNNDKRHVLFTYRAANNYLTFSFVKKKLKTKWIYLNSLNIPDWQKIINNIIKYKIKNPTIKIYWNPGKWQIKAEPSKLKKLLHLTDILQVNKEEAIGLTKNKKLKTNGWNIGLLLKLIHNYGPKIVVITNGVKGVYCYDGKKIYTNRASNHKPVDSTGAGDSFGSGFVAGLILFKGNIKKGLRVGIMNAGAVVSKYGAQNGLMNRREVLKKIW